MSECNCTDVTVIKHNKTHDIIHCNDCGHDWFHYRKDTSCPKCVELKDALVDCVDLGERGLKESRYIKIPEFANKTKAHCFLEGVKAVLAILDEETI